jgi:hypothetical protein
MLTGPATRPGSKSRFQNISVFDRYARIFRIKKTINKIDKKKKTHTQR